MPLTRYLLKRLAAAALALPLARASQAAVDAEEAKQLGSTLT